MTIDESIKMLTTWRDSLSPVAQPHLIKAIDLGIEALKRTKRLRGKYLCSPHKQLPGETKPIYRGLTETIFYNPERD